MAGALPGGKSLTLARMFVMLAKLAGELAATMTPTVAGIGDVMSDAPHSNSVQPQESLQTQLRDLAGLPPLMNAPCPRDEHARKRLSGGSANMPAVGAGYSREHDRDYRRSGREGLVNRVGSLAKFAAMRRASLGVKSVGPRKKFSTAINPSAIFLRTAAT
jgi:hypothetical protein